MYVTYNVLTIKTKLFMYKRSKWERYVKGSSHLKPVNINFGDIFLHLGSKSGDGGFLSSSIILFWCFASILTLISFYG